MNIRFATASDTEALKKMWLEVFKDPKQFVDWNFEHNYRPENVLLCEAGGEIASCLHLIPYEIVSGGEVKSAVYISAVSTADSFRGKGCASKVICAALEYLKNNGTELAFLVPAIDGFYEKFGFVSVLRKQERCFSPEKCDASGISFCEPSVKEALNIYLECMKGKKLYLKRSLSDISLITDDLLNNTNGELKILADKSGYVMYKTSDEGTELFEIMAKDSRAEKKLTAYLYSPGKPVKHTLPPVMIKSFKDENGIYSKNISRSNAYFNLIL